MRTTIIVPIYGININQVYDNIRKSYKGEIIFLETIEDGAAPQNMEREVEDLIHVTVERAEFDHGSTRNLGARLAQRRGAEILIFMTQDAIMIDSTSVEKLIAPIIRKEAVASYGRQLPDEKATLSEKFSRYFQYKSQSSLRSIESTKLIGIGAYRFSNVFSAIEVSAFWAVSGFPEDIILNEDMLIVAKLLKAGYTVSYSAESEVVHSHNYTILQQLRRNFDIGVSITEAGSLLADVNPNSEGVKFALGQLNYLLYHQAFREIPNTLFELSARWLGFQLGKRHRLLPLKLKKSLSMHSYHWDQVRSQHD